jgi:hydrogenase maturation protease
MTEGKRTRHVLVLGIGNLLLRDDGVGVHAIRYLQEHASAPTGVESEIIDCGAAPDLSVFVDSRVDKLVVIDAVQGGGRPGSVYRLTPDVFESEGKETVSLHDLCLHESLAMMRVAGTLPGEVVVIGVEPGNMGWGLTLTPEVEQALPRVAEAVLREIEGLR